MSDWLRSAWDYTVITPPAETPITLAEAKEFMRVDITEDDDLITSMIEAATECGQQLSNRVFVTTGFKTFRNGFGENRSYTSGGDLPLVLRRSPFVESTLFTYKTSSGSTALVKNTNYFEEIVSAYSKLRPEVCWPTDNKQRVQSITIEFTAGYGTADDVPSDIKQALLEHVGFLYNNRGDCGCDGASASESGAMATYQKYRIMEL